jgi:phosphoribosylglycinamide formyltransferase-1
MSQPRTLVILLSGGGSNLQAIINAVSSGEINASIKAVISNVPDAFGLERAESANIKTEIVDHKDFASREDYDHALKAVIDSYAPDLVVLAGFMRILGNTFVSHYEGRMLNIHPSLLPAYRGLYTHKRVLEAGGSEHGASVHFVTQELDGGPVVLQAAIPVLPDDSAESLARRVLLEEHIIYPMAISWFVDQRLELKNDTALLDGKPLKNPVRKSGDTFLFASCIRVFNAYNRAQDIGLAWDFKKPCMVLHS